MLWLHFLIKLCQISGKSMHFFVKMLMYPRNLDFFFFLYVNLDPNFVNRSRKQIFIEMGKFCDKQFQSFCRTTGRTPAKITKCSGFGQDQTFFWLHTKWLCNQMPECTKEFCHKPMLLKILFAVAIKTSVKMYLLYFTAATQKLFARYQLKEQIYFFSLLFAFLEIDDIPQNYIVQNEEKHQSSAAYHSAL